VECVKIEYMIFRNYLNCFQKVDAIIQLAKLNQFWKFKKHNKI